MSTEQEQVRLLAERIARRVSEDRRVEEVNESRARSGGRVGDELAAMRASLEELQQRLAQIESHVTRKGDDAFRAERLAQESEQGNTQYQAQQSKPTSGGLRSPWLSGMYVPAAHPSQERFGVEEATVSELVDFFEGEKKCELEPGGKPCDHCAMCSTRGF
jgi:TolA-binding protein